MPILSELSDVLLGAGALGAAFYCLVLSRRLRRFADLEGGVGGAVAVLSAQVDDLTTTLARAEGAARSQVGALGQTADRAEAAAKRLELLMASLHDLPGKAAGKGDEAEADGAEGPALPVFMRHPSSRAPRAKLEGPATAAVLSAPSDAVPASFKPAPPVAPVPVVATAADLVAALVAVPAPAAVGSAA